MRPEFCLSLQPHLSCESHSTACVRLASQPVSRRVHTRYAHTLRRTHAHYITCASRHSQMRFGKTRAEHVFSSEKHVLSFEKHVTTFENTCSVRKNTCSVWTWHVRIQNAHVRFENAHVRFENAHVLTFETHVLTFEMHVLNYETHVEWGGRHL